MSALTPQVHRVRGTLKSSEALPTSEDQITAEWCSKVLGHKITSIKVSHYFYRA